MRSSLSEVSYGTKIVALHKAVEKGHKKVVNLIGKELINMRYNGKTPLITVVEMFDKEMAKFLINLEADANAVNYANGETALMAAIETGDIEMVKLLVNEGNADVNQSDLSKNMPLHKARQMGNKEIVEFLESKGASEKKSY